MKNKILIIGGTGYLGQHLKSVLQKEYGVYITGRQDMLQSNYIQVDLSDSATFTNVKGKFDCIFILAASIKGLGTTDLNNPDLKVNTINLASFLQYIADENLTNKLVHISSMTVYAKTKALPVSENYERKPLSTYGLSKVFSEDIVTFFSETHNIPTLTLRLPGIYGGNRKSGLIYNAITKAMQNAEIQLNTTGLGYWECMEINDICSIIKQLLNNYHWKNSETINVSYGELIDFVAVTHDIVSIMNSKSKITETSERGYIDFYLDNKKMLQYASLDNNFRTSLKKYIKKVVENV